MSVIFIGPGFELTSPANRIIYEAQSKTFEISIPAFNFNDSGTILVTRERRDKPEFRPGKDFISPLLPISKEEAFKS